MMRLAALRREWMKDADFKAEYDALEGEFSVIRALIEARTRAGLTQEELARRTGATQSSIARMEGGSINPSVGALGRWGVAPLRRCAAAPRRREAA